MLKNRAGWEGKEKAMGEKEMGAYKNKVKQRERVKERVMKWLTK